MVHLRIVAPPALAEAAYRIVSGHPSTLNVVRLPGASERPHGDLILCDVAREDTSLVVEELRRLGLELEGSIAIEPVTSLVSDAARRAERAAVGSPADAVVWEAVESQTSESAELSFSFAAFMVLATLIAAVGIIEDSLILIIGAMVVGPEYGPLAGLCVALVQRKGELAVRSLKALAVGFPIAILASFLLTTVLRAVDSAPDELSAVDHPATLFISHPDEFSALVAVLAGRRGHAVALDSEVRRAGRRPHLRDDDPGGCQRRRRGGVWGRLGSRGGGRPARREPRLHRHGGSRDARAPAAFYARAAAAC